MKSPGAGSELPHGEVDGHPTADAYAGVAGQLGRHQSTEWDRLVDERIYVWILVTLSLTAMVRVLGRCFAWTAYLPGTSDLVRYLYGKFPDMRRRGLITASLQVGGY